MRPIFITLCFFWVYVTSCQTVVTPNSTEKQAIYTSTAYPFLMEGVSQSITLPNSFQIYKKGKAVVYLFLSDQGRKEGFSIVFLDLGKEDIKRFYEFSNAPKRLDMYPLYIQPFFPVFEKEIAKIKIKKKKNAKVLKGEKYYYTIVYTLD